MYKTLFFLLISGSHCLSQPCDSSRSFISVDQNPIFKESTESVNNYILSKSKFKITKSDPNKKWKQERLVVSFIIDCQGKIRDLEIAESTPKITDQMKTDALNIFSRMPPWKPGLRKDTLSYVRLAWPIYYETK